MDNQLWQQNKDFKNKKEVKKMGRVDKYYGVRLIDAIKFAWLDATFAVERKIDKLHRSRVQRAVSGTNVTEEANIFESYESAVTTTTENAAQEAPLGSLTRGLESVFDKKSAQDATKG